MHLTNSRPTLSLCMTGRGESEGNEREEEEEEEEEKEGECDGREKPSSPQDEERSLKTDTELRFCSFGLKLQGRCMRISALEWPKRLSL